MNFDNHWNQMYQPSPIQKPNYQSALGLLSHLNVDELRAVLNDDEKFENLVKDLKEMKDIETEKEMVMASNRSLAEFNLAQEPHLLSKKQKLVKLVEECEALCNSIESKTKEMAQKSGAQSLETVLALLQTAAAEMEEESETVSQKFLEGDLDVEQFLDQFSVRRKLMHVRKVKADKLSEMIRYRSPVSHTRRNNFYPNTQIHPAVPYPTGPLGGMPMPGMFP